MFVRFKSPWYAFLWLLPTEHFQTTRCFRPNGPGMRCCSAGSAKASHRTGRAPRGRLSKSRPPVLSLGVAEAKHWNGTNPGTLEPSSPGNPPLLGCHAGFDNPGSWKSIILEFSHPGALRSWNCGSLESWNPATEESCNL